MRSRAGAILGAWTVVALLVTMAVPVVVFAGPAHSAAALPENERTGGAEALGPAPAAPQAAAVQSQAPGAADPRLMLQRIFASREFASERFGPARWMTDGATYTTLEPSAEAKGGRDIVLYDAATGRRTILVPAARLIPEGASEPLGIDNYIWSDDGARLLVFTNTERVWRQNTRGDYWVLDLAPGGRLRQLGAGFPESTLMFAKFSPDARTAAYVQAHDIYAEEIDTGLVRRLTWDGSETIINGTADWVYEEEFGIRDGFRWSPDGAFIAFWHFDQSLVPVFTMINNTDALYPRTIAFRHPKPGQVNSDVRAGVVPAAGGPVVWLDIPGDPRNNYIARMEWTPLAPAARRGGGSAAAPRQPASQIVIQRLNRLQNTNEVMLGDPVSGAVRTVFVDQDEAWVEAMDNMLWIDGGRSFLWLSERDGWSHVYRVQPPASSVTLVTPGDYDVVDIQVVDEKGGWLYFTASPENPTQRYLYRHRLDGRGGPQRVSPADAPGSHSYQISPTGAWAIHTYSTMAAPPVIDLVALPSHKAVRTLAANAELAARHEALARTPVEFFRIDIGDGLALDAWCLKPPDFDASRSYPLFIYVYGEPAGQTVLDRWGGNSYLWHLYLAQQGYVVASIDPRGTPAPRGRAWRKSVYRKVGIVAPTDHAAAVRALLASRSYLDPERVGIWGWSGGGQMTLNALFRHPDLYKTGIAVAFVADQLLYDTIYQERYMGLPQDNAAGYRDGSPVTHAKNLAGNLLIAHGTGDDNVHYQSFERLVNELIAHGKLFEMMSYPNRSHGISEGPGTTMHLYRTMERFLKEHLPPDTKTR